MDREQAFDAKAKDAKVTKCVPISFAIFALLWRRWEITESPGVTRLPLRIIPGAGPVSTSCSAGLGEDVDAGPSPGMTRDTTLTNLKQLFPGKP